MQSASYHHLSIKKSFSDSHLKTSYFGLSGKEASSRLDKFGFNKLPEAAKLSALALFLNQFKNPLIYILFAALIISFATKHFVDAWIILAVILVSGIVGFLQEYKANKALTHLKQMVKYKAEVLRNGKEIIVAQENIVPGDIIILSPGDKVPADARLIEAHGLEVIESALTGESMPVNKNIDTLPQDTAMADRINMVYLGTVISRGKAVAVVSATGSQTEIGHIAALVKETKEGETPLQKQLIQFGKIIGIILIILNVFIFGLGILTGKPLLEMFMTSVAVVVAAVPEGLLPAMTVILAIGMQRLAKQKGLVRKMIAAETLGAVSVICSDKTGTLTQGEMRVSEIITETTKLSHDGDKFSEMIQPDGEASHIIALRIGLLCNNAIIENPEDELHKWNIVGNSTEKALLLAGRTAGLKKEELEKKEPRVAEIPFDSEYKFMATLYKMNEGKDNNYIIYAKGAPEKILEFSSFVDVDGKKIPLSDEKKKQIKKQYEKLTSSGLRVLAVSCKFEDSSFNSDKFIENKLNDFIFVGLIALKDPLRKEAKETIKYCLQAGIKPSIITGDHKLTAMAIVSELGIKVDNSNVLEGSDLDKITDDELKKIVKKIIVFARVNPKHKIRIVSAHQSNGEVVAMTGDGINDAPALKKADIGIALGSGTDTAKETSDLVLLDNNFKTIVQAVKRGRITFNNIRKVVLYLLTDSFTEMILIGGAVIFGMPLPILPAQILWIKLIESSAPAMSLSLDEIDEDVMKEKPRKKNEPILTNKLKKLIAFYAVIMDITLFGVFYYFWKTSGDIDYARTITFAGLGFSSFFYIYSVRGLKTSILKLNPFSNKYLLLATITGIILLFVAVYTPFFNNILSTIPLGLKEWTVLLCYAILSIIVYEIGKKIFICEKK